MPLPSLRFSMRRLAGVVVLLAAVFAAWYFLIRDDGGTTQPPKGPAGKAQGRPVSKDPVVRDMSVADQAEQVLMLGFEGSPADVPDGLGAILIRPENGVGAAKAFANAGRGTPPLVVASQEGGVYRSFPDLPPGERELDIGRSDAPDPALPWAQATSAALVEAGFHLNLFPVADVATLDSPLAGRAFSDDAAQVAALTEQAIEGCEKAGLACAPLHFPGLGAASQDTAEGPATVAQSVDVLSSRDLVPFRAVAMDAPAMVLSLGLYPDFDAVTPAAMTPAVATDLLRNEVGFKGVAISDDLGSGAVSASFSPAEAAVQAIDAGIDLVQIASPEDADGVAKAIEKAVEGGEIEEERLAQAAERVIDLKRKIGLVDD